MALVRETVAALAARDLACDIVGGGGTGSYRLDTASGIYNELQCGSYAFMDADYGRILDADGRRLDQGEWQNALFLLTAVVSHAGPGWRSATPGSRRSRRLRAAARLRTGGRPGRRPSDEHGLIEDPHDASRSARRCSLVPGHCDPTCNLHDWYVGLRGERVEVVWPVSARGKSF